MRLSSCEVIFFLGCLPVPVQIMFRFYQLSISSVRMGGVRSWGAWIGCVDGLGGVGGCVGDVED